MAFTGSVVCQSFYTDLGLAKFNTGADTFRLALYTSSATLDVTTTAYTATNELPTALGYTAGGTAVAITVSVVSTANGPRIIWDFADATWPASTFTARGGLLYDDTAAGNPAVAVIDFGANKTWPASDPVVFPEPTANVGFIVFGSMLST